MANLWQTVRVFISSTFRDMHSERDWLVKRVFPALRERLEKYRVHLVDIDLRWGVTEQQAESGGALDVCLDQIDSCRPFFLGILGERYGWVPQALPERVTSKYGWIRHTTKKSITELEILYGVLNDPAMYDHSFFCYRDAAFIKDVPTAKQSDLRAEDDESAEKLRALKSAIERTQLPTPPLRNYPCRYAGLKINWRLAKLELSDADRHALEEVAKDGLVDPAEYASLDPQLRDLVHRFGIVQLEGLEEFGERVRDWLWESIRLQLNLPDQPPTASITEADPLAEEQNFHDLYMESRTRVYVGREKVIRALTKFADGDLTVPCLVTGPSGSGKSAATAKFVTAYRDSHPAVVVIPHFIGASPASTSLRLMLRRLCLTLKNEFGFAEEVEQDTQRIIGQLKEFLGRVPADRRVLIVFDALNQLDETDNAEQLHWLPWEFPAHLKVVISCIDDPGRDEPILKVLRKRKRGELRIEALTDNERLRIVRDVPSLSAKTLDDRQVKLLLKNPATQNPLFLLVALEELRGFGSFEQLNARIQTFPHDGDTVTALFIQVIERLEHEFGALLTRDVLTLLASARRGLSEHELQELTKSHDRPDDLFAILRQLRPYLQPRGELLDFYHRNLSKAVVRQYRADTRSSSWFHSSLAKYFFGRGFTDPRTLDELPYHLTLSQSWHALFEVLTSFEFLTWKCATKHLNVSELIIDFERTLAVWPDLVREPSLEGKPILAAFHETLISHHTEWTNAPDRLLQQCYPHLLWWQHPGPRDSNSVSSVGMWLSSANVDRHLAGAPWLRQITCPPREATTQKIWHHHVNQAFFSNDDKCILTVGEGTKRWDLHSLQPLPCPADVVGSSRVTVFSFIGKGFERSTPAAVHGRWLATTSGPVAKAFEANTWRDICVVDLDTGGRVAQWSTGAVPLHGIAWSPTGDVLATTTHNCRVCLWSFPSGMLLRELRPSSYGDHVDYAELREPGLEWPTAPAFSPDGSLVAVGVGEDCYIWNLNTGLIEVLLNDREQIDSDVEKRLGLRAASPSLSVVQYSQDGRFLAAGKWNGSIRIWDVKERRALALLRGPSPLVRDLAWTSQGDSIAAAFYHAGVLSWRLDSSETPQRLTQCHSPAQSIECSRNGQWVVVTEESGTCHLCDARADSCVRSYWQTPSVAHRDEELQRPVAWGRDHMLVASGVDGSLCKIDACSGRQVAEGAVKNGEANALWGDTPDGRVFVGTLDERILIYDANLNCEREIAMEGLGSITKIRLSPWNERCVMIAGTKGFCFINLQSLACWRPPVLENKQVHTVGFKDGWVAAVVRDTDEPTENLICYVWKLVPNNPRLRRTRAVIPRTKDLQIIAGVAEFTHDGSALWVGEGQHPHTRDFLWADAHCNVIDVSTGSSTFVNGEGASGFVFRMSADPKGSFMATQGADNWIHIWSIPDRRLVHKLECQHDWRFDGLSWSACGDYLAASGISGISVWNRDGRSLGTSPASGARGNVAWHPSTPVFGYVAGDGEPCIVTVEECRVAR